MHRVKTAVGIDIGGTSAKAALVNTAGTVLDDFKITYARPTPAKLFAELIRQVEKQGWLGCGIGISIAGSVEPSTGELYFSPNLVWKNVNVKGFFHAKAAGKIFVENDANSAAWGIFCMEFKKKLRDFVCLTLGAGVGGGIIIDGRIYRGYYGTAGEIGHITIDPEGARCNCGNRGCLETFVGAKYVSGRAFKVLGRKAGPSELYVLAQKGDARAVGIFKEIGKALGIASADLINVLSPQSIVLAGGIASNHRFFMDELKSTLKKRLMKNTPYKTTILISELGEKAGVIGAACHILHPQN
jgi:glucokinase